MIVGLFFAVGGMSNSSNSDLLSQILEQLALRVCGQIMPQLSGPWRIVPESNGHMQLHLICSGGGWLRETSLDEPVWLSTGDLICLPHGGWHILSGEQETDSEDQNLVDLGGTVGTVVVSAVVNPESTGEQHLLVDLPSLILTPANTGQQAGQQTAIAQLINAEAREPLRGREFIVQQLARVLLTLTVRQLLKEGHVKSGLLAALTDKNLSAALSAVFEDPARRWTLDQLAGTGDLSRSTLSRRFREVVGENPSQFLHRVRMRHAEKLLAEEGFSIDEVAKRLDYASKAAFARAYAKFHGCAAEGLEELAGALGDGSSDETLEPASDAFDSSATTQVVDLEELESVPRHQDENGLFGIRGPDLGAQLSLDDKPVIIGRDHDCGLSLCAPGVSRRHCKIERQGETFWIEDLDSTNRTRVNGRVIKRHALQDGDSVRLGQSVFRFVAARPPAANRESGQPPSEPSKEDRALLEMMRAALTRNRIHVLFQPIVDTHGGEVGHYQLLPRLYAAEGGLIVASEFVPVAERYGEIVAIDRWMSVRALRIIRERMAKDQAVRLFISQSADSLDDKLHFETLGSLLQAPMVEQRLLVLEFQQQALTKKLKSALALLPRLRDLGYGLSIAGVGNQADLQWLQSQFHFDYVKLTAGFASGIGRKDAVTAQFDHIVQMAREAEFRVIISRIENAESMGRLWNSRADLLQGNFIQQPTQSPDFSLD